MDWIPFGSWVYRPTTSERYDRANRVEIVAQVHHRPLVIAEVFSRVDVNTTINTIDYARLIAASPDLLNELKNARSWMLKAIRDLVDIPDFDPAEHVKIKAIDSVIAKAEQGGSI